MNHDKFAKKGDGFEVGGFRVELEWKTDDSISFRLCHRQASNVTHTFGWLDVHQTNEKSRRVKMRVCLDHNFLKYDDQISFIETVCDQLSLSRDSYEVTFVSPLKQVSCQTSDAMEFVSYGAPSPPGDNGWDDREGISPLEVISRDKAFGMLLEAFPEFHRRVDAIEHRRHIAQVSDEQYLGTGEMFAMVDALEATYLADDQPQLRRVFEVFEKMAFYGDEYTRHASLPRLFESLLQRGELAQQLKPFMLEKTRAAYEKTAVEWAKWNAKRKKQGPRVLVQLGWPREISLWVPQAQAAYVLGWKNMGTLPSSYVLALAACRLCRPRE